MCEAVVASAGDYADEPAGEQVLAGTPEEMVEVNHRLYDSADDAVWTLAVYDTVHGGRRFANIGGRPALDAVGREGALGPGRRVLEIGCGCGAPALYLAEKFGCQVTGLDLNVRQVERAREARASLEPQLAARLDFAAQDILTYTPARPFDVVFALDVLMLVADLDSALRAAARSLVPGGLLVLAEVLAGPHLDEDLRRFTHDEDGMVNLPAPPEYRRQLEAAGFDGIDIQNLGSQATTCFERILGGLERHRSAIIDAVGQESHAGWLEVSERYRDAFATERLLYCQLFATKSLLPNPCSPGEARRTGTHSPGEPKEPTIMAEDGSPKKARKLEVLGVDAFMLYSDDPEKTARWYARHLGIETRLEDDGNRYGEVADLKSGKALHVGIYPSQPKVGGRRRSVMLNYRVADFDAAVEQLRADGVEIQEIVDEGFGRFAYFQDPDGHPVEIWQPAEPAAEADETH